MALTAMDIYKLLPKTNCGDCGFPTCLAFAMQLANKQVSLDKCPHASEEAAQALASASEPPVKLVEIGPLQIGKETVLFRHEETFHHACGLAVKINDELSDDELTDKIERINQLWFDRIGEMVGVELIAVEEKSGDAERYAGVVRKVTAASRQTPLLLSFHPDILARALEEVPGLAGKKPLLYAATSDNYQEMAGLAKKYQLPLAVHAESLEELAELTPKIKQLGVKELVLDSGARDTARVLDDQTQIRRQALKKNFRPLGYPTIAFADQGSEQEMVLQASTYISKYVGIVVIDGDKPWQILPLVTLRMNIYTDPRVPPTVESGLYEIGEVSENSPVLMTTNFALTYFTVQGEVENSRIPSYILSVDTEGQSVLTAYSAENLNAEITARAMEKAGLKELVKHRTIIIPGYIAVMSGALEAESDWKVRVGPREATGIPNFLKDYTA